MTTQDNTGTVACPNWDSFTPQPLTLDGTAYGVLMPRATQAELDYGIQGWSRPEKETRRTLIDPANYHWEMNRYYMDDRQARHHTNGHWSVWNRGTQWSNGKWYTDRAALLRGEHGILN